MLSSKKLSGLLVLCRQKYINSEDLWGFLPQRSSAAAGRMVSDTQARQQCSVCFAKAVGLPDHKASGFYHSLCCFGQGHPSIRPSVHPTALPGSVRLPSSVVL